jgi:hypothetical protein
MILKDPTDPTAGPTNREYPQPDPAARGSSSRPPSPNPTLPDYETSEAQQPSNLRKPSRIRRFWNSRVGRLLSYALVLYSAFILVVGVPIFVLVSIFIPRVLVSYWDHARLKRALRNRNHTTIKASSNGTRTMVFQIMVPCTRCPHRRWANRRICPLMTMTRLRSRAALGMSSRERRLA